MTTAEELKDVLDMLHTHEEVTRGGDPMRPGLIQINLNVQIGKESDEQGKNRTQQSKG